MKFCLYAGFCFENISSTSSKSILTFFKKNNCSWLFFELVSTHRLRRDLNCSFLLSTSSIRRRQFTVESVKVALNAFSIVNHFHLLADPQSFNAPPARLPCLCSRRIIPKLPTSIIASNLLLSRMVKMFLSM